jgi:hypothetical protein
VITHQRSTSRPSLSILSRTSGADTVARIRESTDCRMEFSSLEPEFVELQNAAPDDGKDVLRFDAAVDIIAFAWTDATPFSSSKRNSGRRSAGGSCCTGTCAAGDRLGNARIRGLEFPLPSVMDFIAISFRATRSPVSRTLSRSGRPRRTLRDIVHIRVRLTGKRSLFVS